MTPYEIKLQERAEAVRKIYWASELGHEEIIESLAALSLTWSAEDYEKGWEDSLKHRLKGGSLIQFKIINGFTEKPQTETL